MVRLQAPLGAHSGASTTMSEQMDVGNNTLAASAKGSNSLATKVTAVLSTSFSDTEFREALALIDQQEFANDAKNRRQIRINLHKDVIDSNGTIIDNFGRVSEVSFPPIITRFTY